MKKFFMISFVAPMSLLIFLLILVSCNLTGDSDPVEEPNTPGVNAPPVLSSPLLFPNIGTESTDFTFRVTYSDPDESLNTPVKIKIGINGTEYDMTYFSVTLTTRTYEYETQLPIGTHDYYFSCEADDGDTARLPITGHYSGPVVAAPKTLGVDIDYNGSISIGLGPGDRLMKLIVSLPSGTQVFSEDISTVNFIQDYVLPVGEYIVFVSIDTDGDDMTSYGDSMYVYENIISLDRDDMSIIDLSSDRDISIIFDDENRFGFITLFASSYLPPEWDTDSDSRWSIDSGQYIMSGTGADDSAIAYFDEDVEDFTLQCKGLNQRMGASNISDWGLFFHFDDIMENGYVVSVNNSGVWELHNYTGGTPTFMRSGAYTVGNSLRVTSVGNSISIYSNNILVGSDNGSAHTDGYCGIFGNDDDPLGGNPQVYAFDDLWMISHH